MSIASQIKKAEASIIKTMGVNAIFTTYTNENHPFKVLPKADTTETTSGDFRSRESSMHFEALAEDIPADWRDSKLEVGGDSFNIVDIEFDSYNVRAEIFVD